MLSRERSNIRRNISTLYVCSCFSGLDLSRKRCASILQVRTTDTHSTLTREMLYIQYNVVYLLRLYLWSPVERQLHGTNLRRLKQGL
jgi:hypothetical protein